MESDLRIVIIGARWSGKSSTANSILGGPRFEHGRARTLQCEDRSGVVSGVNLTVVDVPGWNYFSIKETSQACRQNFKLSVIKCHPGPHVFLLVIPLDMAFTKEQGQYVQEYLSLLGDQVWRYVVVVFTCRDFLDKKTTIDEHIKGEGEALQKVLEKCEYRFQEFDNKNKTNPGQVSQLLSKIEELVKNNDGGFYKLDKKVLQAIIEKRELAAEKAWQKSMENDKKREKERQLLNELEREQPITELRVVLLGSRNVGKSSTLNTILGDKVHDSEERTTRSVMHEGYMDKTRIEIVDTPGWWRSVSAKETTELVKQELKQSVFLCRPGPHVFLLVIDTDASFSDLHHHVVKSHLKLLGEDVWRHVIVVFSRGDCLREETIEEHIEIEGKALISLINKCGNRYHVLRNRCMDGAQVTELIHKMKALVVMNKQDFFKCDENVLKGIEENQRLLKQRFKDKIRSQKEKEDPVPQKYLSEIRLVLLGQKTMGKSASGNTILCQGRRPTCFNTKSNHATADVAGRKIVVVDTLGWSKYRENCTLEQDEEIIRGLTLCHPGPHAFLLILPIDMAFTSQQQRALKDHMLLFGEDIWKHTIVVFTYGDQLKDQTVEEHIIMEGPALQQLLERCGNRYHVLDNKSTGTSTQVPELLEKIEKMVAFNDGQHYLPNMAEINHRLDEKFEKQAIAVYMEEKWKQREAEMMEGFSGFLSELLTDLKGARGSFEKQDTWKKHRSVVSLIKQSKRIEEVEKKISEKINSMEIDLQKSTGLDSMMRNSIEFIWPSIDGSRHSVGESTSTLSEPNPRPRPKGRFKRNLEWLSALGVEEKEDPPTFNFSQATSGYESIANIFSVRQDDY